MEAAGTIVGVVTLGLAVCDGVIEYCRAWRHQHEDIQNLQDLTDKLSGLLEDVASQLQRNPSVQASIVERLQATVEDCNKHIQSLLRLSQRYSPATSTTKGSKFKDFLRRLKYPLEKKAIAELKDLMTAFCDNVKVALSLLAVDVASTGVEATEAHRRDSATQSENITKEIHTAQEKTVSLVVSHLDTELPLLGETIATKIDHSTVRLEETILQTSTTVTSEVERSTSLLHHTQLEIQKEQHHHFRAFSNKLGEIERFINPEREPRVPSSPHRRKQKRHRPSTSLLKFRDTSCTCNVHKSIRFHPTSGAWFEKAHEIEHVHDRTCPQWFMSEKKTNYNVEVQLLDRFRLSGQILVKQSKYTTQWMPTITQNLRFKLFVPETAPAFSILGEYFERQERDLSEILLKDCLQDLWEVFNDSKGSPNDCIANGANLIDMSFVYLKLDKGQDSTEKLTIFKELILGLIRLGVDFHSREQLGFGAQGSLHQLGGIIHGGIEHSLTNVSLGSSALASKGALNLLAWLSNQGYELSTFPSDVSSQITTPKANYPFGTALDAVRLDEDFAIDAGCGKLSMAVIRHQLDVMEVLLKADPNAIAAESQLNIFGYNPLHIALGWPEGLTLLLKFADDSTLYKTYPTDTGSSKTRDSILDYAISNGCDKSVRLFAKEGISFHFEWSRLVGTRALTPAVSDAIAELTAARLRGLYQFTDSLSPDAYKSLDIRGFDSFDSKAKAFIEHCLDNDIKLPRIYYAYDGDGIDEKELFCPPYGSVYHQDWLEPDTAQSYFDNGLREVDSEFRELTPLMMLKMPPFPEDHLYFAPKFYDMVHFFVRNGAQLERPIPERYICDPGRNELENEYSPTERKFKVVHRIASLSWANVSALPEEDIELVAKCGSSPFWVELLGRTDCDSCVCACSIKGCRAITLACKSIARRSQWASDSWVRWQDIFDIRHWERTVHFLTTIGALFEPLAKAEVEKDVIRFLTFAALDMTHTCCVHEEQHSFEVTDKHPEQKQHLIRLMEATEIEEIRDEEKLLIEQLDELVDKFMKDLHTSGRSLSEFLREDWQRTMFTILSDEKEPSNDDFRRLSDVGVCAVSGREDDC